MVLAKTTLDNKRGVLVVINCETDFVAKNEDFGNFANTVLSAAVDKNPSDIDALKGLPFNSDITIGDKFIEQIGKIGEKIDLPYYQSLTGETVYAYNHPGNRLACVVAFNKVVTEETAKNVAMQVAAMAPVAVDKDDVNTEMLERELEIAREQIRAEGKPEDMVEKIAQGKINKFYKESTLLNQEYIKDNKLTIKQYLQSVDKDLTVSSFKRYALS